MKIVSYNSDEFINLGIALEQVLPVNPLIATCGGRSIIKVLEPIKTHIATKSDSKFLNASYMMIDERVVPLSDEDSNFKLVNENFLANLISQNSKVKIYPFETSDPENSIKYYSNLVHKNNNKIDLIFLGVGEDGHIAGLFPNLRWQENVHFFTFDNSPKPPSTRMTASEQLIANSTTIVIAFLGESKRTADHRSS